MATAASATGKIAERYASALIDTAAQAGSIESVEKDMGALAALIHSSNDFLTLTQSPLFGKAKQYAAVSAIAAHVGIGKMTINFLGVLIQNRRLAALPAIVDVFGKILSKRRGEIRAKVVTAAALTPEQERTLQDSLKKSLGFKVALDKSVDPALLGGMVVTVGSRMFDDSIKRKLERLKIKMQSTNQNQNLKEVG